MPRRSDERRKAALETVSRLADDQLFALEAFLLAGLTPEKPQRAKKPPELEKPDMASKGNTRKPKKATPEELFGPAARSASFEDDGETHAFLIETENSEEDERPSHSLFLSDGEVVDRLCAVLDMFNREGAKWATGKRFACIYLASWGRWETRSGQEKRGWVWHWWNRGGEARMGDTPSRGYGVPDAQRFPVSFEPVPRQARTGGKSRRL